MIEGGIGIAGEGFNTLTEFDLLHVVMIVNQSHEFIVGPEKCHEYKLYSLLRGKSEIRKEYCSCMFINQRMWIYK